MKKFLQIGGGILLVLLVIGYFSSNDKETGTTTTQENKSEISAPQKPAIEIISQNFVGGDFGTKVVAEIKNNSDRTASYIDLKSVFYNEQNAIVGTGMGNATDIGAGQTKTIDILTMDNVGSAKQFKVEIGNVMWE